MFGALMVSIKTIGRYLIPSGGSGPVSLSHDDEIQMVKRPQGPVDFVFDVINRCLRPAMLFIVLWMFYWFTLNPELAKTWIGIVKDIPSQMWDAITIILVSVGLSKVIRDVKTPTNAPQMVVRTTPEDADEDEDGDGKPDGSAKPELDAEPATPSPTVNPTLAEWKKKQQEASNEN